MELATKWLPGDGASHKMENRFAAVYGLPTVYITAKIISNHSAEYSI